MKKTPSKKTSPRHRFKSSMSVSRQVICEDDACIGKQADTPPAPPSDDAGPASDAKPAAPGSMTVAGQPACQGEACIGKK